MTKIKPGDQIICCVKEAKLVSPYSVWEEEVDLTVLALDDENSGCFVYVPDYIYLKGTTEINTYNIKALGVPPKYVGCFCLYVSFSKISRVGRRLDGMICDRCKEFHYQADSNQENGGFLCFLCRTYRYR